MKQKVFTLGDKFAIENERGEAVYFVEGEIFTLGHKLSFQDAAGNELIYIRQKVLTFPITYELYRGEQHVATINKEAFTFFHCTFDIHVDAGGDFVAEGNLTDHEYSITRGGRPVASISKQWFKWGDTYGVEIDDREDAAMILASTVVIDMCCHEGKRR